MLIRDLEYKTGLDRATIRFYEREGLITPERKENGYRTYSEDDCGTLLKIKLLRQLDMSLEKIKELQQGRGELSVVLAEQLRLLEAKMKQLDRAKDICAEIRSANISYDTLDAAYYLERLNRPVQSNPVCGNNIRKAFREPIQREYHPVRRIAARMLDYTLITCILRFLLIVVLRVRPFDFLSTIITYSVPFLAIPLNALMLRHFGTTPGKWLMGLRVESENGGHLHFGEAMEREWAVLRYGVGFGIPLWEYWKLYKCYRHYNDSPDMEWDWQSEYSYSKWDGQKKVAFAVTVCISIMLTVITVNDAFFPKYRSSSLTTAQFAENYNFYLTILNENVDTGDKLQSDGTRYPVQEGTVVFFIDGQPENEHPSFTYELNNDLIRKIKYHNRWEDIFYCDPITTQCMTAAFTALASQEDITILDLYEFGTIWDQETQKENGQILYRNIEVNWQIESKNCMTHDGHYTESDEKLDSSVMIDFEIIIHE